MDIAMSIFLFLLAIHTFALRIEIYFFKKFLKKKFQKTLDSIRSNQLGIESLKNDTTIIIGQTKRIVHNQNRTHPLESSLVKFSDALNEILKHPDLVQYLNEEIDEKETLIQDN